MFQHTAAQRRLQYAIILLIYSFSVSTHSRAEAAAVEGGQSVKIGDVSTHSRAEAAAYR